MKNLILLILAIFLISGCSKKQEQIPQAPVIEKDKEVVIEEQNTNLENGMSYVGQSVDIAERWKQHIKRGIGAEAPTRNKLYPAMLQFGVENFTFEIVEECDSKQLDEKEKYWCLHDDVEYEDVPEMKMSNPLAMLVDRVEMILDIWDEWWKIGNSYSDIRIIYWVSW